MRGSFDEVHSGHPHEAVDILAPRGTPIHAVDDGTIAKLFESKPAAKGTKVNWRFTTQDARIKLKRLYPVPQPDPLGASLPVNPARAKLGATEAAARSRQRTLKRIQAKQVCSPEK